MAFLPHTFVSEPPQMLLCVNLDELRTSRKTVCSNLCTSDGRPIREQTVVAYEDFDGLQFLPGHMALRLLAVPPKRSGQCERRELFLPGVPVFPPMGGQLSIPLSDGMVGILPRADKTRPTALCIWDVFENRIRDIVLENWRDNEVDEVVFLDRIWFSFDLIHVGLAASPDLSPSPVDAPLTLCLIAATASGRVLIIHPSTAEQVCFPLPETSLKSVKLCSVASDPESGAFALGMSNGTIYVYHAYTRPTFSLSTQMGDVLDLTFPNTKTLLSLMGNGKVLSWKLRSDGWACCGMGTYSSMSRCLVASKSGVIATSDGKHSLCISRGDRIVPNMATSFYTNLLVKLGNSKVDTEALHGASQDHDDDLYFSLMLKQWACGVESGRISCAKEDWEGFVHFVKKEFPVDHVKSRVGDYSPAVKENLAFTFLTGCKLGYFQDLSQTCKGTFRRPFHRVSYWSMDQLRETVEACVVEGKEGSSRAGTEECCGCVDLGSKRGFESTEEECEKRQKV